LKNPAFHWSVLFTWRTLHCSRTQRWFFFPSLLHQSVTAFKIWKSTTHSSAITESNKRLHVWSLCIVCRSLEVDNFNYQQLPYKVWFSGHHV